MKRISWLVGGIVGIILLLFLFGGGMMASGSGYQGWGMAGPGGMMGNWGYSPIGGIWVLFSWLVAIGIIVLIVLGVVWLMRRLG